MWASAPEVLLALAQLDLFLSPQFAGRSGLILWHLWLHSQVALAAERKR